MFCVPQNILKYIRHLYIYTIRFDNRALRIDVNALFDHGKIEVGFLNDEYIDSKPSAIKLDSK